MSSKPEFVIIPGAWHFPDSFKPTTDLLEKAGYTSHGVTFPSTNASPQVQSFDPDVQAIRTVVDKVLSSGKDVVLVTHSYGGVVGCESLAEYVKTLESGHESGHGKVKRMVFVCAFVLPEGGSLMAALQNKPLPWFILDEKDIVNPANPQEIFYNDISPSVAEAYISKLGTHSYPTFSSQLTVAPWKVIPSTYVLCEKDNAIPIGAQEGMVAAAKAAAPRAFDVVERCDASHSPFISQPEWLAEKLIKAAQ
ncbi:alpha/beta-hydrolase [Mollisia scopiformis]|uniref:Alpha/beta-hydrolase n=1 Tax=Mollisia scopiformis TaxID=149040 RepID=A0A194X3N0_MOLSC|nr:alpha/beta-hydrolase [Mollisia scopiformis]KUJ14639.1 alpha/beta-hydrolase [Mollisia scopiformis]